MTFTGILDTILDGAFISIKKLIKNPKFIESPRLHSQIVNLTISQPEKEKKKKLQIWMR